MLLIQRDKALTAFDRALAQARDGTGSVLFQAGAVLSGRTALLGEFAARGATVGVRVIACAGSRAERDLRLGLVDQFWQLLDGTPPLSRLIAEPALAPAAVAGALMEAGRRQPVLVTVDNLHDADAESLRCLLHLARRARSAPVLIVSCGGEPTEAADPGLYSEFIDAASITPAPLAPLSPAGVRKLVEARTGVLLTPEITAIYHATTGGSPLLTHALAEDLAAGEQTAATAYERAVLRGAGRFSVDGQRVLLAAAVLQDGSRPTLIARLTGIGTTPVRHLLTQLAQAGLVLGDRVRHPRVGAALQRGSLSAESADMHGAAARLLRDEGAPPAEIATQLVAAGRADEPWAVGLLRLAATHFLDRADPRAAADALRLAHHHATDPAERAAIKAALVRISWRHDPALVRHLLDEMADAAAADLLEPADIVATMYQLLWFGRYDDARVLFSRLGPGETDPGLWHVLWLSGSRVADWLPGRAPGDEHAGDPAATLTTAEQTLQRTALNDDSLFVLVSALLTVVYAGQPALAEQWCARLRLRAAEQNAPAWEAVLCAIQAEAALRRGRLTHAEQLADEALTLITPAGWGVVLGAPLSIAVRVLLAMGRGADAARRLEQPVPDEMFAGIACLMYLDARGQLYLDQDRPAAALADFEECGRLMGERHADLAELMPWRLRAAESHLRLGRPDLARELALDQLRATRTTTRRVKGLAHALIARTGEVARRPAGLHDAVTLLESADAWLEAAWTLSELGRAQRALGDSHRARVSVRRAWQIARECQADGLSRMLLPELGTYLPEIDAGPSEAFEALSDAERRVASLAAAGHTNRQIANRLFITISTVEQHLTRVYRKLSVQSRAELASSLPTELSITA